MPSVSANGITLEYESFGDPGAPPLLLIMGLGGQMIHWHERFCALLAAQGLRVIRFDNRDAGRSTVMSDAGSAGVQAMLQAWLMRQPLEAPYLLSDMAADVVGLMDALDIEAAHICGMSMGGMIGQLLAIEHRERVLSLTSMMSTPGGYSFPAPDPSSLMTLLSPAPADREGFARRALKVGEVLNANTSPLDAEKVMDVGREAFDRGYHPAGLLRQTAAVLASGSREAALRGVTTPTLVLHGEQDPLVPVSAGRATAAAVPGARFVLIPGMGHYLPPSIWGTLLAQISAHALHGTAPNS